jgi:hypothetical protein
MKPLVPLLRWTIALMVAQLVGVVLWGLLAPARPAGPPANLMDVRAGWEESQDIEDRERVEAERKLEDDEDEG